jgi:hypothetical protein
MVKFWFAMISTFPRSAQAIEFSMSESNPCPSFGPLQVPDSSKEAPGIT